MKHSEKDRIRVLEMLERGDLPEEVGTGRPEHPTEKEVIRNILSPLPLKGREFMHLLPALFDLHADGLIDGVPTSDGKTAIAGIRLNKQGRAYLSEYRSKTPTARIRRTGIGVAKWAVVLLAGFFLRDGYEVIKGKLEGSIPHLSLAGHVRGNSLDVEVINRGEPTDIKSIRLLCYSNRVDMKRGKPFAEVLHPEHGSLSIKGLQTTGSSCGNTGILQPGETEGLSISFGGKPGAVVEKLRKGIVVGEVQHTMSDVPVTQEIDIPAVASP